MVSVNTNDGAIAAVASLRRADAGFITASKRVESGFRVADAFDDASVFSVAQGVRAEVKSAVAIQSSLAQGENTARVALAGLRQISDLTSDIRAKILLLADGAASDSARVSLKSDAQALYERIGVVQSVASYNGRSQLDGSATSLTFIADSRGNTISVGTFNGAANYTALGTALNNITDTTTAVSALGALNSFEEDVSAASGSFAASQQQFEAQRNFIDSLVDASRKALGALIDTDVAETAVLRESAIVQKNLSLAAIALANNSTRRVVDILR